MRTSATPKAANFPMVCSLTGRPITFSAAIKNRCPPSSGRNGSRLNSARLRLMIASSGRKNPCDTDVLATEVIPTGPLTFFTNDRSPVTRSPTNAPSVAGISQDRPTARPPAPQGPKEPPASLPAPSPTRSQTPYKRTKRSRDLHAPPHGLPDRLERPIEILDHHGPHPDEGAPGVLGLRDQLPRYLPLLPTPLADELDPVPRLPLSEPP